MITKFNIFENVEYKQEKELREKISAALLKGENAENIDYDFPFPLEMILIHEREYVEDIYWGTEWNIPNLTLGDFKWVYSKMLKEAKEKVETAIKEDPTIYSQWNDYFDYDILNIPEWIKQSDKYNL